MSSIDTQDEAMELFEKAEKAEMETISNPIIEEQPITNDGTCEEISETVQEDTSEIIDNDNNVIIEQEVKEEQKPSSTTETIIQQPIFNAYDDTALMEKVTKLQSDVLLIFKKVSEFKFHEKIEENMHNEIQEYKKDFYATLIKPFLREFISLSNSMQKDLKSYLSDDEDKQNKDSIELLKYYIHMIQGILSNNGVERYTSNVGDKFEAGIQQIAKTIATDDETLNGTISESKNDGYKYEGKVFVPERVLIYKFQASPKPITETQN